MVAILAEERRREKWLGGELDSTWRKNEKGEEEYSSVLNWLATAANQVLFLFLFFFYLEGRNVPYALR